MGGILLHSSARVSLYGTYAFDNYNTNVPPGVSNIVGVAASSDNGPPEYLAIRANGTVAQWAPAYSPAYSPAIVNNGLSNIIAVSAGYGVDNLAVRVDGTVVGWNGAWPDPFPGKSNVVAVAVGNEGFLALQNDGTVLSALSMPPKFPFPVTNAFFISTDPDYDTAVALLGNGAPAVAVQPGNQFVNPGETAWLHARGVGVQPMTCQWQFEGVDLVGATNFDLTLTNLSVADFGNYQAFLSNAVGVAATRVAVIGVASPGSNSFTVAQALNATNLIWTTDGAAPWFAETTITHDGVAAAQSGSIGDSERSTLQTVVTGPGILTFWWKVSSEQYFDLAEFYIDDNNLTNISGEVDWQEQDFLIGPKVYDLTWIYAKDPTISDGEDACWLDQVSFAAASLTLGSPAIQADGGISFRAYAADGGVLNLAAAPQLTFEVSSNLVDWTSLTSPLVVSNGIVTLYDPGATNDANRFYRLNGQ